MDIKKDKLLIIKIWNEIILSIHNELIYKIIIKILILKTIILKKYKEE